MLLKEDIEAMQSVKVQSLRYQLTGSNWFRTSLKGLDFTTNFFTTIALSQDYLAGLIVNQEQALVIAQALGLQIKD